MLSELDRFLVAVRKELLVARFWHRRYCNKAEKLRTPCQMLW